MRGALLSAFVGLTGLLLPTLGLAQTVVLDANPRARTLGVGFGGTPAPQITDVGGTPVLWAPDGDYWSAYRMGDGALEPWWAVHATTAPTPFEGPDGETLLLVEVSFGLRSLEVYRVEDARPRRVGGAATFPRTPPVVAASAAWFVGREGRVWRCGVDGCRRTDIDAVRLVRAAGRPLGLTPSGDLVRLDGGEPLAALRPNARLAGGPDGVVAWLPGDAVGGALLCVDAADIEAARPVVPRLHETSLGILAPVSRSAGAALVRAPDNTLRRIDCETGDIDAAADGERLSAAYGDWIVTVGDDGRAHVRRWDETGALPVRFTLAPGERVVELTDAAQVTWWTDQQRARIEARGARPWTWEGAPLLDVQASQGAVFAVAGDGDAILRLQDGRVQATHLLEASDGTSGQWLARAGRDQVLGQFLSPGPQNTLSTRWYRFDPDGTAAAVTAPLVSIGPGIALERPDGEPASLVLLDDDGTLRRIPPPADGLDGAPYVWADRRGDWLLVFSGNTRVQFRRVDEETWRTLEVPGRGTAQPLFVESQRPLVILSTAEGAARLVDLDEPARALDLPEGPPLGQHAGTLWYERGGRILEVDVARLEIRAHDVELGPRSTPATLWSLRTGPHLYVSWTPDALWRLTPGVGPTAVLDPPRDVVSGPNAQGPYLQRREGPTFGGLGADTYVVEARYEGARLWRFIPDGEVQVVATTEPGGQLRAADGDETRVVYWRRDGDGPGEWYLEILELATGERRALRDLGADPEAWPSGRSSRLTGFQLGALPPLLLDRRVLFFGGDPTTGFEVRQVDWPTHEPTPAPTPDAGIPSDAGAGPELALGTDDGCGCRATSDRPGGALVAGLLALLALRRRRRGLRAAAGLVALLSTSSAHAAARPIVAVFDFEARGVTFGPGELESLSEYVSTELSASGRYEVVPRTELKRALAGEKAKSYDACYDESCQIEIGKEIAAEKSLAGTISKFGSSCIVTLRLFDLARATGEAGATHRGGCQADDILTSVEAALAKLAGKKAEPQARAAPPPTPSPRRKPAAKSAAAKAGLRQRLENAASAPAGYTFPTIGRPDAPVHIVAFMDFQCPFSKRLHQSLMRMRKDHEGKLRITYRHFPLSFHKEAEPAARAAIAAHRQDRFWTLASSLFAEKRLRPGRARELARKMRLDQRRFERDFESEASRRVVRFDLEEGKAVGVRGTPAFYVNGERFTGAQPDAKLEKIFANALRAAQ